MKLKAKKKLASRKNILIASTVGAVMLFGGVSAYYVNTSNQKANTETVTQVEDIETIVPEPTETPKAVTATEPTPTQSTQVVTPSPTPEPVKTIQEYGVQYLGLESTFEQECFDAMVARWPERFTADVREENVKALRIWASVCASGITQSIHTGLIFKYGLNGEFFDSALADVGRNK